MAIPNPNDSHRLEIYLQIDDILLIKQETLYFGSAKCPGKKQNIIPENTCRKHHYEALSPDSARLEETCLVWNHSLQDQLPQWIKW
jgi:hypothetical protein